MRIMQLTRVATALAVAAHHYALLADAASTLQQVIVVSRHGVRGPYGLGTETPQQDIIDKYVRNPEIQLPLRAVDWGTSENDDPIEVVSPKLTKHGYAVVEKMGEYFRKHLYQEFLDATPCGQVFAYADANQRDNLTAEAFLSGAFKACKEVVPITAGTRLLFEQGQDPTATCPVCSQTMYKGIAGADDCRYLVHENRKEIAHLNSILDCCAPSTCVMSGNNGDNEGDSASLANDTIATNGSNSRCTFFDIPSVWNGAFYQPWKDALSSADYFTEFLMLQALNNMTLPRPFTFEKVLDLSKVHESHMDLVTNDVNSANFGATLLAHITASFEQRATGKPVATTSQEDGPQLDHGPDNRFLYYAGHDINILYLRNLLRLQWFTRGWHPHQPTPGGMLIFELHERSAASPSTARAGANASVARHLMGGETPSTESTERHFVEAFFVTASPKQMRNGATLSRENPPDRVPVIIPFCSEDELQADGTIRVVCPFDTFKKLIGKMLKHECVADTLRPFIESLDGGSNTPSKGGNGLHTLLWVLFAVLIITFLVVVVRHMMLQRRHKAASSKPAYGTLPQVTSD